MPEMREVDLTGLKCPMPIVELNRIMKEVADGEELLATADDPAFCLDVEAWCKKVGSELVKLENTEGKLVAVIRKKQRLSME